jgi:hypothetical protein
MPTKLFYFEVGTVDKNCKVFANAERWVTMHWDSVVWIRIRSNANLLAGSGKIIPGSGSS